MRPVLKPEVLLSKAAEKFDANRNLIDETARDLIKKKLQGLKDLILQLRSPEPLK